MFCQILYKIFELKITFFQLMMHIFFKEIFTCISQTQILFDFQKNILTHISKIVEIFYFYFYFRHITVFRSSVTEKFLSSGKLLYLLISRLIMQFKKMHYNFYIVDIRYIKNRIVWLI